MSAIALSTTTHPSPTPFCDKSFKCLRLTANFVTQICLSIFCTAISYLTCLCSKKISHQARCWSHIYLHQSIRLFTYLTYGNRVIEFSMNIPPRVTPEKMEGAFTKEAIEEWARRVRAFGPVDMSKLKPRACDEGCCNGMSLEFIATYLKELRKGSAIPKAIQTASLGARDGASKEAELAQIFGSALDRTDIQQAALREIDQIHDNLHKGGSWLYDRVRKEVVAGKITSLPLLEKVHEGILQILEQAQERELQKGPLNYVPYGFGLGKGITTKQELSLPPSQQTRKAPQAYTDWFNGLSSGAYQLTVTPKGKTGHAMALIKTDQKVYCFDSNRGTLAIDPKEGAKITWDLCHLYCKGVDLELVAAPCCLI